MFQRIFGTAKKDKAGKSWNASLTEASTVSRHEDPARSGSITEGATRTTSPPSGKRHRRNLNDNRHAAPASASPPSLSPMAASSPPKNLSITIRSDPVPAGFKSSNNNNTSGTPLSGSGSLSISPKFRPSSLSSSHAGLSFKSPFANPPPPPPPLSHPSPPTHASGGSGAANSTASGGPAATHTHATTVGNISSRPVIAAQQRAAMSDLQGSRTASSFNASQVMSTATRSNFASSGSLAVGPGTAEGTGVAAAGSSVNYWRLPWTQQKVVMCPYCNRPIRPKHNAHMQSKEHGSGDSMSEGVEDDHSEADSRSSSSSGAGAGAGRTGLGATLPTYCRCCQNSSLFALGSGHEGDLAVASGSTTHQRCNSDVVALSSAPQPVAPPVFIVETQRSANVVVPGTIADDFSSSPDDESDDGNHRTTKLSLVSPLTSMLLRNATQSAPASASVRRTASGAVGHADGEVDEEASPPIPVRTGGTSQSPSRAGGGSSAAARGHGVSANASSVSSWLQEQHEQHLSQSVRTESGTQESRHPAPEAASPESAPATATRRKKR